MWSQIALYSGPTRSLFRAATPTTAGLISDCVPILTRARADTDGRTMRVSVSFKRADLEKTAGISTCSAILSIEVCPITTDNIWGLLLTDINYTTTESSRGTP